MEIQSEPVPQAEYTISGIPQYDSNPLIAGLPPILSEESVAELLERRIAYTEQQRSLPIHIRQHAVLSTLQFFQPLSHHFELESKISKILRFGYVSRNPLSSSLARDGYSDPQNLPYAGLTPPTAMSSNFIGTSGMGKTTAIDRILSLYPQVIDHTEFNQKPVALRQVAWLKLQCPHSGSVKGLCLNFFREISRITSTDYLKMYGATRLTTDQLVPVIAAIANLHSLGILVIDEIQHLSSAASGGSRKMLNFFVELTNTVHVPVFLIGTTKAISVITQEFRSARRSCGLGETIWKPMDYDEEWEFFVNSFWKYQYTQKCIPLTEELLRTLHYESQGITDFAVKLYLLSQIRAITTHFEQVNCEMIRSVARDSLGSAQPFLCALRNRNFDALADLEDLIHPLDLSGLSKKLLSQSNKSKAVSDAAPKSSKRRVAAKRTKKELNREEVYEELNDSRSVDGDTF